MKRLLRDIGYFCIFCLMVLGIGGVMYHAVGKGGWIDQVLGGLLDHSLGSGVVVIAALAALVWAGRRLLWGKKGSQSVFNDALMYGVVVLGIVFAGRLMLYGSL